MEKQGIIDENTPIERQPAGCCGGKCGTPVGSGRVKQGTSSDPADNAVTRAAETVHEILADKTR